MLAVQVDYWKLVEQKRHNVATEQLDSRSVRASEQQAEASQLQARASLQNASTNVRLAEIKSREADIAAKQAEAQLIVAKAQERNAATNAFNATINARNAESQAQQARAALKQADVAQQNARTNLYSAKVQEAKVQSEVSKNRWETSGAGYQLKEREVQTKEMSAEASRVNAAANYYSSVADVTLIPYKQAQLQSEVDVNYARSANLVQDTNLKAAQTTKTERETSKIQSDIALNTSKIRLNKMQEIETGFNIPLGYWNSIVGGGALNTRGGYYARK